MIMKEMEIPSYMMKDGKPHKLRISATPWLGVCSPMKLLDANGGDLLEDLYTDDLKIMSAAPEMLDALVTALQYADKLKDEWPLQKHVKDKMRNAIEKAIGKEIKK